MKILISTGIYPPKIGGPSEYSKNLKNALEMAQNRVKIATFGTEEYMPTGVRHTYFFIRILPKVMWSNLILCMDTYSVAFPTVFASKIFGRKTIIRTGGDFLWEQYIERTGKKVLFRNFYKEEINNLSLKERIIFSITRWTLLNASFVVFSTEWQRGIFIDAYGLDKCKTGVIENYYGNKEVSMDYKSKTFVASGRELVLKNSKILKEVFDEISSQGDVSLYSKNEKHDVFMEKIAHSYAVVCVSVSEISPNLILDSIRFNKPFICTKEIGILDRVGEFGIFIDPLKKDEIKNAVLRLLDKDEYLQAVDKIKKFTFTHSWGQIAEELLSISNKIK